MLRRLSILGCLLALAFPLAACDGEDPVADSGMPGVDSGTPPPENAPPVVIPAEDAMGDPIVDRTMGTPANFACRGTPTAPTGGADATFDIVAEDFFSGMTVEGLTVHFFPDNNVADGCTGDCISVTTDASGVAEVTAPEGGWYAYRIEPGQGTHNSIPETYVPAIQINEAAPAAGGTGTLNAVRQSTVNTLTSVLLINQQPGTSIVTGVVTDCDGAPVANARVRVFSATEEVTLGTDRRGPKGFYFNGDSFPAASETESHVDGLYGAGNIPVPSDGQLRVELWGVTTAGGEPELLGCERVTALADGITIVNIGPLRADGPGGCSGE